MSTLHGCGTLLKRTAPTTIEKAGRKVLTDAASSPNYDPELVERAILEEVIDRHPERLTVHELALRIVADPDDGLEVETATNAIRELRRSGLVRYRNDEQVVDPTQAALRAHALLSGLAHGRCS